MKLHELHASKGANKPVTRKGRGIGSGNGKTAGFIAARARRPVPA